MRYDSPGRILAVVFDEQRVEFRVLLAKFGGQIEKTFGAHGEKLGFVRGAVGVEQRRLSRVDGFAQLFEFGRHYGLPAAALFGGSQGRRAVDRPIEHVELMSELVPHQVTARVGMAGFALHLAPRQNDRPAIPSFAQHAGVDIPLDAAGEAVLRHLKTGRIDQDRQDLRKIIVFHAPAA